MKINGSRRARETLVNNAITFMAQDRNTAEEAYAGDIIGIPNHGAIRLGETFSEGETASSSPASRPSRRSCSARRGSQEPAEKVKQLQKGLQQLAGEGATQLFRPLRPTTT